MVITSDSFDVSFGNMRVLVAIPQMMMDNRYRAILRDLILQWERETKSKRTDKN